MTKYIGPLYLFACLVLGGSAQGVWQNTALQLGGVVLMALAAVDQKGAELSYSARQLLIGAAVALIVVVLQLVPLPPDVWPTVGGRLRIAAGFSALNMDIPAEPLSLSPAAELNSVLACIPPLALFCAMVRLRAYRSVLLALALIGATALGIVLGALQVAHSSDPASPWYLYPQSNVGRAVGFFANANHMATLLLVSFPFLVALGKAANNTAHERYSPQSIAIVVTGFVLLAGIALNGSVAGYGLALPIIASSALIIIPPRTSYRGWVIGAASLLVAGGLAATVTSSIGAERIGERASTAVDSRTEILSTTIGAIQDFMPYGSGLGSFRSVYQLYERPERVSPTFVVHAHNDYAEFVLEFGAAGGLLLALFLLWWGACVWRTWRSPEASPFALAAAISSAAILVHSLVDFPLRTTAIAVCFSMCLAILSGAREAPTKEKRELRKSRHAEFR